MSNSNQVKSGYVKDSAGNIWYAVSRDQAGGFNAFTTFYSDIRCDPATVGTPAPGQLLPVAISGGGGSTPSNIATNDKLDEIKAAVQSTTEDDQTQSILNLLVNEANDSQTLLTNIKSAIDSASDEAVITKLTEVKTAIEDTTEDDQTQAKLDSLISAATDTTEDDQTQTAISNLQTAIDALKSQNLSEFNESQDKLSQLLAYYVEGSKQATFSSEVKTADFNIPAGAQSVIITNEGTKPITLNGARLLNPGATWSINVNFLQTLPGFTVVVDASDASPKFTIDKVVIQ